MRPTSMANQHRQPASPTSIAGEGVLLGCVGVAALFTTYPRAAVAVFPLCLRPCWLGMPVQQAALKT